MTASQGRLDADRAHAEPVAPSLPVWLDGLDAAHAAATPGEWREAQSVSHDVHAIMVDGIRRAWLPHTPSTANAGADAAWIVAACNAVPRLVAAVRAVAALADELDEDRDTYGYRVRNGLDPSPGARLRAALAPLTEETDRA